MGNWSINQRPNHSYTLCSWTPLQHEANITNLTSKWTLHLYINTSLASLSVCGDSTLMTASLCHIHSILRWPNPLHSKRIVVCFTFNYFSILKSLHRRCAYGLCNNCIDIRYYFHIFWSSSAHSYKLFWHFGGTSRCVLQWQNATGVRE